MAGTRVNYNHETIAEAVRCIIRGRQLLAQGALAIEVATNANETPANLELAQSPFFGVESGKGSTYRTQVISIKNLIDAGDAGGLATFLSNLDNGGT